MGPRHSPAGRDRWRLAQQPWTESPGERRQSSNASRTASTTSPASPLPDHVELRAAWLQLAPDIRWRGSGLPRAGRSSRTALLPRSTVVGHLPADAARLHASRRGVNHAVPTFGSTVEALSRLREWILPPRPSSSPGRPASQRTSSMTARIPEAVAHVIADAIRGVYDYPGTFAARPCPARCAASDFAAATASRCSVGCSTSSAIPRRRSGWTRREHARHEVAARRPRHDERRNAAALRQSGGVPAAR